MNVLVVDDDESVRRSVSRALKSEGYNVLMAADGQEAVDRYDPQQIDLLLLDLGLPVKSGWDTFEQMTRRNPVMPVIIITGKTEKYPVAVAAGAGAFMEKPLDVQMLLETMRELLEESEEERLRRMTGHRSDVRHIPSRSTQFLEELEKRYATPFHDHLRYGAMRSH